LIHHFFLEIFGGTGDMLFGEILETHTGELLAIVGGIKLCVLGSNM